MHRGDIVKDNSGAYAVFTEQGSSASQMTAAKIRKLLEMVEKEEMELEMMQLKGYSF